MVVKKIALLVLATCVLAGQTRKEDGDELILVPKKYLSPEALAHRASPDVEAASSWVGVGKEIGAAVNGGLVGLMYSLVAMGGLAAVVDQTDRFGATRVGVFVMAMVAWKVIGSELVDIVFGIPICLAGVLLWIWSIRRFFFPKRVLVKSDGKLREWGVENYKFATSDGRAGCVAIHACFLAVWLLIWTFKIF